MKLGKGFSQTMSGLVASLIFGLALSGCDDGLRNAEIEQGGADIIDDVGNVQGNNDTKPPAITLLGDDPLSLNQGDTYEEPGASAMDDSDGDLTAKISIDSSGVTTTTAGNYAVTYNVADSVGNQAEEVTRTVVVAPIQPADTSPEPLLCGDFTNPGYKNGQSLPDESGTKGVTFGPGRHVITEQILLSSGEVLSGAGSDQTTLYFPDGLIEMGHICRSLKDCWSWENGMIVASGTEIGVQNLTIEFPAHSFSHYKQELGAQPGYNGIVFESCENCWAKDVHVINSDVGFIARWSNNVTIEDTSVTANNNGSHLHYSISTYSNDILVNIFSTYGDSHHGITAQWGVEQGVFSNGTLIGPTRIEPEHNGPVSTTLYSDTHGDVDSIQMFNRNGDPVSASFVNVNGKTFGVPCAP
jgi:hypothetical protein